MFALLDHRAARAIRRCDWPARPELTYNPALKTGLSLPKCPTEWPAHSGARTEVDPARTLTTRADLALCLIFTLRVKKSSTSPMQFANKVERT